MAISAIVAVAAVAGTAYSAYSAKRRGDKLEQQQEYRREAAEKQRQIAARKNAAKRRKAIAQQRIQMGAIRNQAATSGTLGSSGSLGAQSALSADTASMLGLNSNLVGLNRERLSFLGQASAAGASAQQWGARGQLGMQLGSTFGSFRGLADLGGGASTTASTPDSFNPSGTSYALPSNPSSIQVTRLG